MSSSIIITLLESDGFVDDLISFRLESNWVHAVIEVDEKVYSSTFPVTICVDPSYKDVSLPPRTGTKWVINVTDDQKAKIIDYCDSRVGTSYDVLSMLGWLFRIRALQVKNLTYCFELVYDALNAGGLVPDRGKKFITGDQLEEFILKLGGSQIASNAVGIKKPVKMGIKFKKKIQS